MWYIYTMEYDSAIRKNEIRPFAARWMDPETQTERSKSDRGEIAFDIPYMWNSNDTNELTSKTENKFLVARKWGRIGGRDSYGVWEGHTHTDIF